ncbi:PREDICTED: uncharacterized protein LOC108546262, partial [Eufriesea mexicana]|uniref:uncharacterized protein LOC108546262 n=1 Tax=Eufriesea mexicana TaxID=516756 RepID=UPI00083C6D68
FVMKHFKRSVSSLLTSEKINNMLTTHLKLDCNTIKKMNEIEKNNVVVNVTEEQIIQNCLILQHMDIQLNEIYHLVPCLMLRPMIVRNRIFILKEIGIDCIDLHHIHGFPLIMRKSIKQFKKLYVKKLNNESIVDTIFSNIVITNNKIHKKLIKIEKQNKVKVGDFYQLCVMYYKKFQLELSDELAFKRKRLKYQSLKEIKKLVHILKYTCEFNEDILRRNSFLLNLNVDDIEKFFTVFRDVKINDKTMIDIVKRYPRILFCDINNTKQLLQLYETLKISNNSLYFYVKGLKVRKDKFLKRYASIANNLELSIWLKYPRILNMIYCYKLVMNRLNYIQCLNYVNNANIHTYLSNKKVFLRFAEGDVCSTGSKRHLLYILSKELGEDKAHMLLLYIRRHPFWKYIPLQNINDMLHYLKQHYSIEDICQNIHIILYPRSKIDSTLKLLYKEYSSQAGYKFTPAQYLALCLYKLEKKYHFSGDAVWQSEVSVFKSNIYQDSYEPDNFVEYINNNDNEAIDLSGTAWFDYLLQ